MEFEINVDVLPAYLHVIISNGTTNVTRDSAQDAEADLFLHIKCIQGPDTQSYYATYLTAGNNATYYEDVDTFSCFCSTAVCYCQTHVVRSVKFGHRGMCMSYLPSGPSWSNLSFKDPVLFEENLSVRKFTLNRPSKLNALDTPTLELLAPKLEVSINLLEVPGLW